MGLRRELVDPGPLCRRAGAEGETMSAADLVRRMPWPASGGDTEILLTREWLVTNGLGGYASGTVSGVTTRRHHGMLVAAMPAPLGRMVMLKYIVETVQLPDGRSLCLGGEERGLGELDIPARDHLREFRLEAGLPVWRFEMEEVVIERRLFMPHRQNTVYVVYRLLAGPASLRLEVRPSMHFRPHEGRNEPRAVWPYELKVAGEHYEISAGPELPVLRVLMRGTRSVMVADGGITKEVFLRVEADRGYDSRGSMWTPGYFVADLGPGRDAAFIASTEPWHTVLALDPQEALDYERRRRERLVNMADPRVRDTPVKELVLAADQFIITPAGRVRDAARAHAAGDEVRSVIAGYHWFTDWGRDTMISLEGLTLVTGRHIEAGWILRTFAHYVGDGLIPNMFPESNDEGLYHTADATLWFFHAIDRYVTHCGNHAIVHALLPVLEQIIAAHLRGTRFCIGVDPADGLLKQGLPGYQLTWMDAKVGDWVVTPRRGKAVEINGLWYNALRLLEGWVREVQGDAAAQPYAAHADRAQVSFNERFWYARGGYLYDVVDGENGDDNAFRPNQLLAFSLRHPVLVQERWQPVLHEVERRLLTPVGLRSLAPDHPDYKARYFGDLHARDAAYHQGTVWGWLVGPFVDAWLRVHPDDHAGARRALEGFVEHFGEACVGSISEIFDAEPPYTPRGCIAQAWSVAEVLRCWAKTAP
ncbi:MAG: amylo-alpha-1,6-glucosidase [Hydrogenophaga sp.]